MKKYKYTKAEYARCPFCKKVVNFGMQDSYPGSCDHFKNSYKKEYPDIMSEYTNVFVFEGKEQES